MHQPITKSQIISALVWKFIERGGNQMISFLVSIILARLLTPKDYGVIALVTIFITFANIFIQSGFSTSLIQKKYVSDADFNSAFSFSLLLAFFIYIAIYISAPSIALFYDNQDIIAVLRVISISLFFGSLNSVQNAIVARNMQFKKLFGSSTVSVVVSGFVGVILAYNNYGVWALVAQQTLYQVLVTLLLLFVIDWKPKLQISIKSLKSLINFGSNILLTNVLATVFLNIRNLVVGKIFNSSILGFYNRGMQFPAAFVSNINGSIQSVMLPAYSSYQDNSSTIRNMVRRSIKMSSFIVFPMMIGLAVIAEPLVVLLLTEKWISSVIYIQIYCLIYAIMPIHTANLQAIKALGHSSMILKIEIVKKAIDVLILIISIPLGVPAIAFGELISGLISTIINAYPSKKYLDYSTKEQWADVFPSLMLAIFMGIVIFLFKYSNIDNHIILIMVQVFFGGVMYISLATLFKFEEMDYLMGTLKYAFKKG